MRHIRNTRGFTLVELLIVIIIIAVLAAVVVPKFANSSIRSKEASLRADLKTVRNAINLFHADTGSYPFALADLTVDTAPPKGKLKDGNDKNIVPGDFRGPYIEQIKNNPVSGAAYNYSISSPTVGNVRSAA